MSDSDLPQVEADELLAMDKTRTDDTTWLFPGQGGSLLIPLVATAEHEEFLLDVERGNIKLVRRKYQTRGRKVYVLARLDIEGPPHRNPEAEAGHPSPLGLEPYCGLELGPTHMHVYLEGWGDRWAMPLEAVGFSDKSRGGLWSGFMDYCNIVAPPDVQWGLF